MNKVGSETEALKLNVIKTDSGKVFITDSTTQNDSYFRSKLPSYMFDGKLVEDSGFKNWYILESLPVEVTKQIPLTRVNYRWELKDKFRGTSLPLLVSYEDLDDDDEDYNCYDLASDTEPAKDIPVQFELHILCEVTNFELPEKFDYKAVMKAGWSDKIVQITDANLEHGLVHKLLLPSPLLSTAPCKLSSEELYGIVRQHVIDNIDHKEAIITSNYDFCFTVKKKIKLIEPKKVTFTNPFERTKKARQKVHVKQVDTKQVEIFEMTHAGRNYQGYTPIPAITGANQQDLKDKLDNFLEELMEKINRPLEQCECCQGTGYKDVELVKR